MAGASSGRGRKNSLLTFLVGLFAGAAGIYAGSLYFIGSSSFVNAAVVALVGAAAWAVTSFLLGWVPLLGSIITFAAWLAAISWFYPGGWITAAKIGLVAWLVSLAVLYVASALGFSDQSDAVGVPGA